MPDILGNLPAQTAPAAPTNDILGGLPARDATHVTAAAKPKALHDPTLVARILGGLQWAAESPVGKGLDAVLNAPQRAVSGTLLGGVSRGATSLAHPATATGQTHDLEQRFGLPTLDEKAKAPWYRRVGQGIEDFAVETATDPITYVPGLDVVNLLRRGGKALGIARAAEAVARHPVIDRALGGVVEGHNLRKSVTRAGEDIVKGREAAGSNALQHTEAGYGDLVDQHRDALNAVDAQAKTINERLSEIDGVGGTIAGDERTRLKAELESLKDQIPPEIRHALLQRSYLEGTPKVRRQALAHGYVPTAEEQARPPMNILHGFRDVYEPTQTLYDKTALEASSGPIFIRQGNKKAAFDLPKTGSAPSDPLADRILDRLVRGARLEEYHGTRRGILHDLGLTPTAETEPIIEAISAAAAKGDARRVGLLTKVLHGRQAAAAEAEAKRAATLQPGVVLKPRSLEFVAPQTARERALRSYKRGGGEGTLDTGAGKAGEVGFLRQLQQGAPNLAPVEARGAEQARSLGDLARISARTRGAVGETEAAASGQALSVEQAAERLAALSKKRAGKVAEGTGKSLERLVAGGLKAQGQVYSKAAQAYPGFAYRMASNPEGEAEMLLTTIGRKRAGIVGPLERQVAATKKAAEKAAARAGDLAENLPTLKPRFNIKKIIAPSQRSAGFAQSIEEKHARAAAKTLEALQRGGQRTAAMDEVSKVAEAAEQAGNLTGIPETLDQRLFGDRMTYSKNLLAQFSDLQRDALFVLPFAHMKNIAVLAALGPGGLRTLQRGWRYAHELRTNPQGLEQRVRGLEGVGATHHYIAEHPAAYEKIPVIGGKLEQMARYSNKALERYDLGMRLALEDELGRRGVKGFAAGGQIRDVLGDYNSQAPIVELLRKVVGANFPGWRLGVVPRALTKALREQPRATHAYSRAQRLAADDVTGPAINSEFDMGGPAEDYATMVNPYSLITRYLASPSTIGVFGMAPQASNALKRGELAPYVGSQLLRIIPGGSMVGALAGFPYPSNAPAAARAGAGLFGAYFPKRLDPTARRKQLAQLGLKGKALEDQMRAEGYYRPAAALPAPLPLPGSSALQAIEQLPPAR